MGSAADHILAEHGSVTSTWTEPSVKGVRILIKYTTPAGGGTFIHWCPSEEAAEAYLEEEFKCLLVSGYE